MLNLKNKSILITGGTGSFGKNFVNYLLKETQARRIIVFSRDELKQSQMLEQLKDSRLRFFLGDVRDKDRLERAFHGVDIVVHAAALKQVPTLEYNPYEAVKTNIIGTQNIIDAAIDQKVKKVLLISTDKAAQPSNLYGSTKLCAEKLIVNGNLYAAGSTSFSCVRYGNVIGSRGSIIETLMKNKPIKKVTITDESMTRFWISLNQSFDLVMYALENMVGGEIYVPKMPSMKLSSLFDAIAPKAKKEIIGIRPGEKLHEILLTCEEARHSYELGKYYVILPEDEEIFSVKQNYKNVLLKGKKLSADFSFKSENNDDKLSAKDLNKIISKMNF